MKIHIITGHFHPQLHPRAFRSNELALEFARRGYDVTVTNCWTIKGFDYETYAKENGISIHNLNILQSSIDNKVSSALHDKSNSGIIKTIKNYYLGSSLFYRGPLIANRLQIDDDTDLVIALSTPFTCLYGLSKYVEKKGKKWVVIADSGDPFYGSKQTPRAIWFKYIERSVYKKFDYLTIPTENAIPLYEQVIPPKKIAVIPQGFRMDNLKLYHGQLNNPVKFAYAGVFYRDIRNPEFLFKYLSCLNIDFEFYLFMRCPDDVVKEMMEKYPNLKDRVKVSYSLPHDKLLYELSTMHFLVNIENDSNTQMPSKLIDYGMSGRPIFSCKSTTFSEKKLLRFMQGDYKDAYEIDIKKYDIVTIANQFIELYKSVER